MRRLTASLLVAVMTAPGRALPAGRAEFGVQLPTGAAAGQLHDWNVVRRLPEGAHVLVEVDPTGLLDAHVEGTDPNELTLRRGDQFERVPRDRVVRVVRVESMSSLHAKQRAIGGLLLGGLAVVATGGLLWFPILLDPPRFAGAGAISGIGEHRQTLVYERS